MTGHEIGLLKGYMLDLVEQARQESMTYQTAGYQEQPYTPDQALMDLLAILDDRLESEGIQVGLSEEFRHRMWEICKRSLNYVKEESWLEANLSTSRPSKAEVRSIAYRSLLEFIEGHEN
ncbi:MAG TPA: hypothetical protein VMN77_04570 [Nitrospiria bacterium]|jgi:hypothetical protein|nr:hypothetical protein [Nitrospiria bacterium]